MAKLNIAIVAACPFPTSQGSQVLIKQTAESLQQAGHRVQIVTYHLGQSMALPQLRIQRIPPVPGYTKFSSGPAWGKLLLDLLLIFKLWQIVRQEAIDLIHAHNYEGLLAGWLVGRLTGRPVIYHSHNVMSKELHTYTRTKFGRWVAYHLGRFLDAQLPRRADACIVLSQAALHFFREHRVTAPIALIPPGMAELDNATPWPAAEMRARYNLGPYPVLIYTGNLDKYQSIGFLLGSFRQVLTQRPEVHLLIVSESLADEYQAQVARLNIAGQVHFIQPDSLAMVQALLNTADIAICPRVACFGFPIKLLNYMAAAKAIVVAAGSAKGIHHLVNGYIVASDDESDFAQGIVDLLDQPALRERLGRQAKMTVENCHRWPQLVTQIEMLYDLVMAQHPTHRPRSGEFLAKTLKIGS